MPKSRPLPYRIDEEWFNALAALAGTFGASAEEVVQQSLPDVAVTRLFFQCQDYLPELRWDEVAQIGREAIRKYLRAKYLQGVEQHLARLGLSMEQSSAQDVEAARQRILAELRSDGPQQPAQQLAKAQEDSVYLGCLYEAWKRAKAGEPGYTIDSIEIGQGANAHTTWAVFKDGQVL
ncbi:MAG: hypothetical protein JW993_14990 [Sedimentisphaerales bacterium]|nr:hypothetical protein [Sedimentisphaerales bacterium]